MTKWIVCYKLKFTSLCINHILSWWAVSGGAEAGWRQIRPFTIQGLQEWASQQQTALMGIIVHFMIPTVSVLQDQPTWPFCFFASTGSSCTVSPLPAHLHFTTLNPPPSWAVKYSSNTGTKNYCRLNRTAWLSLCCSDKQRKASLISSSSLL